MDSLGPSRQCPIHPPRSVPLGGLSALECQCADARSKRSARVIEIKRRITSAVLAQKGDRA